jgi:Tfp pilus assembly protein PilN
MRAVNLIPAEARKAGPGIQSGGLGPGFAVLGLLGLALLLVTIYVLTSNTISDRKVQLADLQAQVAQEQAAAGPLASYASYAQLAQARVATVTQIAQSRFDWHAALADLSRVVPRNASLTSLVATSSPSATVTGGGGNTSSLRGDIAAPAFQISGCTTSHDDVARLMSRLRLINGVQRVTLSDSVKQSGGAAGVSSPGTSAGSAGCATSQTEFDLVVFFVPIAGAPVSSSAAPGAAAPAAPAAATPTATATPATSTAPSSAAPPASTATSPASGGTK